MCEARRAEYVRLLDEEGMNFTQAAHAVGVSKRTGKAWRNGRTRATGRNEKPLVDWYRSTMDKPKTLHPRYLSQEERIQEIAQMISGANPSQHATQSARELLALRQAWQRAPQDLDVAVAYARRCFEEVAAEGDPRHVGHAQAALKPWFGLPDPPAPVRVLRAQILQFDHRFGPALVDLDAVLRQQPDNGDAWAWRTAILMVQADYPAARRSCDGLAAQATPLIATACRAQVDAATGQAAAAAQARVERLLEQVGLPDFGDERRVPGLRREEVAQLAGVTTDYYTRLERGNIQGASDSVLNAIARALRLTDVEREHLFALARPVPARERPTPVKSVRPSLQRMLDSFTGPAVIYDVTQEITAANVLGRALFAPLYEHDRPNMARFTFLDSRAPEFYQEWLLVCSMTAATLRLEAGRDPLNEELTALIGELSTRSPQFRRDWADNDVHEHRTGTKGYRHPVVGEIELQFDNLEAPGEPGLQILTYTAELRSPAAEKLLLLASWAATQELDPRSDTPGDD